MENGERLQRYKNINIVTVADAKRPPSAQTRPEKLDIILDRPKLTDELTRTHSWNPDDKSSNVFVKEDNPYVLHRHPVAQSTDCVRGKVGYKRGFHVWEVKWPTRQRGTHAVIGIATAKAPLQCTGYQTLVGNNPESWGWDIGRNKLYHNEKNTSKISYPEMNDNNFTTPESIRVILDMEEGTMAFEGNDQYYGVAFRDLKGKTLYPIVSAVWGHCEVEMRYLGGLDRKYNIYQRIFFWFSFFVDGLVDIIRAFDHNKPGGVAKSKAYMMSFPVPS